ncbi:DnaT-like ssDNA-binding protein [Luteibacter sp. E-22]|uniref:DnaT-like ssDNA-binding protein n=1 Tax=Luteibacter sp. E-22 TaxID=3404050 RepID=UPI003CF396F8
MLIVEDGTGKSDAEAYISVADADAYFSARGNEAWAALDTTSKEQALRKGSDYMAGTYGPQWKGERVSTTQALDWPRKCVRVGCFDLPSTAVPSAVARANAEMAVRSIGGDLQADQSSQVKQETVGPITVVYSDGARQGVKYAAVDGLLGALLRGGGVGSVQVVRA